MKILDSHKPVLKILLFLACLAHVVSVKAADTLIIESAYLPKPDTVIVIHPNQAFFLYQPILLILPDRNQNPSSWVSNLDLQTMSDTTGWIIVCPGNGGNSWFIDSPFDSSIRHSSYVVDELLPQIMRKYHTDTSSVFILGFGMGGHGAMTIFLANQNLLAGAGNISGPVDLSEFSVDPESFRKILGPGFGNMFLRRSYSAIGMLGMAANKDVSFCLSITTDQSLESQYKDFAIECTDLGIPLTLYISNKEGDDYIQEELIRQFNFFRSIKP